MIIHWKISEGIDWTPLNSINRNSELVITIISQVWNHARNVTSVTVLQWTRGENWIRILFEFTAVRWELKSFKFEGKVRSYMSWKSEIILQSNSRFSHLWGRIKHIGNHGFFFRKDVDICEWERVRWKIFVFANARYPQCCDSRLRPSWNLTFHCRVINDVSCSCDCFSKITLHWRYL